ncbi:hypothetical protein ACGVWS_14495 [Enterobacteriaceae bacterium LUAb1]
MKSEKVSLLFAVVVGAQQYAANSLAVKTINAEIPGGCRTRNGAGRPVIAAVIGLHYAVNFMSLIDHLKDSIAMFEINPVKNRIQDLSERSHVLRGYL